MKTLVIFALALFFIPLQQGRPAQSEGVDPRLKMIKEEIEKTTPEGKEVIEHVKRMLPEVNAQLSALPLEKLVEKVAKENKLTPLGWAAAIKPNGRWKVVFYYKDERLLYPKDDAIKYQTAEWEYNPEEVTLYPFEEVNAPQFWSGPTRGED